MDTGVKPGKKHCQIFYVFLPCVFDQSRQCPYPVVANGPTAEARTLPRKHQARRRVTSSARLLHPRGRIHVFSKRTRPGPTTCAELCTEELFKAVQSDCHMLDGGGTRWGPEWCLILCNKENEGVPKELGKPGRQQEEKCCEHHSSSTRPE